MLVFIAVVLIFSLWCSSPFWENITKYVPFFFWLYLWHVEVQGLNPRHSREPGHRSDDARSLTH